MKNLLPTLMVCLTKQDRYLPEIKWAEGSWVFKLFRLYELVFWRKVGIRPEITAIRARDGKTYYAFHTWEALLVNGEGRLKEWFKGLELLPIKIYIPQLATPQGVVFPSPYLFAIAYETSGNAYTNASTTASLDLASSGTDRLAVIFTLSGGGNRFSSVTVEGQATTTVVTNYNPFGAQSLYGLYYIAPPTSSSTTYLFTLIDSADDEEIGVLTYSGCHQTSPIDSSATNVNAAANPALVALTTTVVASNCWLVSCARNNTGGASASTGTTLRQAGTSLATGDSNGTVGTGSQSMSWTRAANGTTGGIVFSIAPAVAAGPANLKSYDTNLKANIKSMNTNLIANVKTFDTNA